jgi:hypothetical protein
MMNGANKNFVFPYMILFRHFIDQLRPERFIQVHKVNGKILIKAGSLQVRKRFFNLLILFDCGFLFIFADNQKERAIGFVAFDIV